MRFTFDPFGKRRLRAQLETVTAQLAAVRTELSGAIADRERIAAERDAARAALAEAVAFEQKLFRHFNEQAGRTGNPITTRDQLFGAFFGLLLTRYVEWDQLYAHACKLRDLNEVWARSVLNGLSRPRVIALHPAPDKPEPSPYKPD